MKRKIIFVTLYELIAVVCITVSLTVITGQAPTRSSAAALMSSAIAISWNFLYTLIFEAWESRQIIRGRNLKRRITHALGYEGVLLLIGVPLYAWWLDVSVIKAFMLNIGFVAFFLFYSFSYNWAFDTVFGLPTSACVGKDIA